MSPESSAPAPAERVQTALFRGAIAALIAGGMSAAASLIEGFRDQAEAGVTLPSILIVAAIIPQVFVLIGFLRIADHMQRHRSNALHRSSICVFAALWMMTGSALLLEVLPEPGGKIVHIAILGALTLGGLASYATKNGGGLLVVFLIYLGMKSVSRDLLGLGRDPGPAMILTWLTTMLLSVVVYQVWQGIVLICRRDRIGPTAAWLGWAMVLSVVAAIGFVTWVIVSIANDPQKPWLKLDTLEEMIAPYQQPLMLVELIGVTVIALLTAVMFWSYRERLLHAPASENVTP